MCTKKCAFLAFTFLFIFIDIFLNQLYMTDGFTDINKFLLINSNGTLLILYADLLVDIWIVSIVRDIFLLIISFIVVIDHRLCHKFIKFMHHKYINALLCLCMYSYAMIKLLLHADNRKTNLMNVFMLIWNIIAAFLYFISMYLYSLLKVFDYKKTNIDGGELENGEEADIFLGNFKLISNSYLYLI